MGNLIPFPNHPRPKCPREIMLDGGDLIESGESLALMWNVERDVPSGRSGGQGQGFFNDIITQWVKPLFCEVGWVRLLLVHLWYFEIAAWISWFERAANTAQRLLQRRQS